jgi:hypothetical protein
MHMVSCRHVVVPRRWLNETERKRGETETKRERERERERERRRGQRRRWIPSLAF